MDLIGIVVVGMNTAHDISAGKEQKQILLLSPFLGCFLTPSILLLQPVSERPFSSVKG